MKHAFYECSHTHILAMIDGKAARVLFSLQTKSAKIILGGSYGSQTIHQ